VDTDDDLRALLAGAPDWLVDTAAELTRLAMSPRRGIPSPSAITSMYTWPEELCNDDRVRVPFEDRVAEWRDDWRERLERVDAHGAWPTVRVAVARYLFDHPRDGRRRLERLRAGISGG